MATKSGMAVVVTSLVMGAGIGTVAGGCGEDRGSVDVEGPTTGGTVGTSTTETTTPETTTETTGTTESGY